MSNAPNKRMWRRLLRMAAMTAVVGQVAGCLPTSQEVLQQLSAFGRDFTLQALAAYLL